ncbi:MAG: hypothetical protein FJ039_06380 [Chloroflexi bacterium]|nr:hypothetical protein [Chloroflexota bacterium]
MPFRSAAHRAALTLSAAALIASPMLLAGRAAAQTAPPTATPQQGARPLAPGRQPGGGAANTPVQQPDGGNANAPGQAFRATVEARRSQTEKEIEEASPPQRAHPALLPSPISPPQLGKRPGEPF